MPDGEIVPSQFDLERRSQSSIAAKLCKFGKIKFPRREKNRHEGEQHRHASHHCVNEKLGCRRRTIWSAPQFDQKERRDETQFPKNEPMNEVQGAKSSKQAGL